MIFRKPSSDEETNTEATAAPSEEPLLGLYLPEAWGDISEFSAQLSSRVPDLEVVPLLGQIANVASRASACLVTFGNTELLDKTLDTIAASRKERENGTPTLILAVTPEQLTDFGEWLYKRATEDRIHGLRLIAYKDFEDIAKQLPSRLGPVVEPNIVSMPTMTEVDNSPSKYLFAISPSLRATIQFMQELAENNISRIYLLGGPGTGKTTLSYYYWLRRGKGRFVTVNLNSESTGDKASMKSLLCGHVTGAVGSAGSREGALSFAKDGVCFLDESHGVTGTVMQVLMEVLDSGQYLPFGATAKRALECAVIFASNRSWETLRGEIALDEHARLGAIIVGIHDLKQREEDLIAVLATTLAKFKSQCTTWQAPSGVTHEAWQEIMNCPWRGNLRTLIRVTETASVTRARQTNSIPLLQKPEIQAAIELWEPEEHESHNIFASYES